MSSAAWKASEKGSIEVNKWNKVRDVLSNLVLLDPKDMRRKREWFCDHESFKGMTLGFISQVVESHGYPLTKHVA